MGRIQLTIDCGDPDRLVPFWCTALGYIPEPAPDGFATWREYYLSLGESPEDLGDGDACDCIIDPDGVGPRIWFQVVPEPKTVKNRVHVDVLVTNRTDDWGLRREQLAARRDQLVALGGSVRRELPRDPSEHLACGVNDPEGNELCLV